MAADGMAWAADRWRHAARLDDPVWTADGRRSEANTDHAVSGDHAGKWREHDVFQFCRRRDFDHRCADSAGDSAGAGGAAELYDPRRGDNAANMAGDRHDNGRGADCHFQW